MDGKIDSLLNNSNLECTVACPMCGSQSLLEKFKVRHVCDDVQHSCGRDIGFATASVVSCRDCSFVFKPQRPSASYLENYYAHLGEGYLASLAEDHREQRRDFQVASEALAKAFPKGGTILEVGCASGFFLDSLGKSWNRFGIELFHLAAEQARSRNEITVHECDLQSAQFPAQSFDVVCCFDVIEHLPDPAPLFSEARCILKPSGWLLLGTGDCASLAA